MAKITICKKSDYTVLDNGIFRDKRLSLKARGLLVTMLSLPEEWNYTIEGLSTILKEGKSSIRSALSELEEYGYLVRKRVRNEKGQLLENEYIVYEKPSENLENKEFEPKSENPTLDNPILENQTQLNINKSNKEKENKYLNILHRPSGQIVSKSEMNFSIVEKQIAKEINSLGYGQDEELINNATEVFRYYYDKYYSCIGSYHLVLSSKAMRNTLERYINGSEIAIDLQYDIEAYKEMIDRHFTKDYGEEIDYSICHFMTEGIRNYLFYEVLY